MRSSILLASAIALAGVVLAQTSNLEQPYADLVLPVPAIPVVVEQEEEHRTVSPDGIAATKELTATTFRDSAGRLRVEGDSADLPNGSTARIFDPVDVSTSLLFQDRKFAIRMVAPKVGPGKSLGFGLLGSGELLPPGVKSNRKIENLGTRVVAGLTCEGTRVTFESQENPAMTATFEEWVSKGLGVVALKEVSGASGKHVARIRNISRQEPEPTLFKIPADYTIREFQVPDDDRVP